MWHAQITELCLRQLPSQQAYLDKDDYTGILTVKFLDDETVFIERMLKKTGRRLDKHDWFEILTLLREQYGVRTVEAMRHKKRKSWLTSMTPSTDFAPL